MSQPTFLDQEAEFSNDLEILARPGRP